MLAQVIVRRVLTTLHFTPTGVDGKNARRSFMQIGDETLRTHFPIPSSGTLELTEHMKNTLERKGKLTLTASDHTYGSYEASVRGTLQELTFNICGISHMDNALPPVHILTSHDARDAPVSVPARAGVLLGAAV